MASWYIVRHVEAEKTLRAVHGGAGTSLTNLGRQDARSLAGFLPNEVALGRDVTRLHAAPVPQAVETANILGAEMELQPEVHEGLRNLHMGVLAGLSDAEARRCYPDVMARLQEWRRGRSPVEEIRVPDGEPIAEFLRRLRGVLGALAERSIQHHILVITRSVGIGILNTLLERRALAGRPYTRFRLDPGSVTRVDSGSLGEGDVVYANRTDYTGRAMEYPDD